MLINSVNTSYNNRNGLASFKFGSVASFLTLSLLEIFQRGWGGGCLSNCGKSGGMGDYSLLQKTENPGRRGS